MLLWIYDFLTYKHKKKQYLLCYDVALIIAVTLAFSLCYFFGALIGEFWFAC